MQKYQEKDIFKRVRRLGTLKKKQHTGIHIIETYPSSSINNPTAQKELTSKLKLKKKNQNIKTLNRNAPSSYTNQAGQTCSHFVMRSS